MIGQFRFEIGELGIRKSCGRTGSRFDAAAAESFRALLKEETGTRIRPDRATARAEVLDSIETFCNRRRLRKHKAFGYLTPAEPRQRHPPTRPRSTDIECPRARGSFMRSPSMWP
jgi:putative transposase